MDEQSSTGPRRLLVAAALLVLLAGDAIRYPLSWWGYGAVVISLLAAIVIALIRARVAWGRVPVTLWLFHAVALISTVWSFYPGATGAGTLATIATAVAGVFLALGIGWIEFVRLLRGVLAWILGLSLLFELIVAAFVRGPVLPFWVDYSELERIPQAFYWSRGLLFEGGRIQGIVGNANLLGMLALLALIVFIGAYAAQLGSRGWNIVGVAIAVATLALTRSTTVLVALVITAFVVAVAWLTRRVTGRARLGVQLGAVGLAAAAVVAVIALREPLLALVGKSPDLTNRLTIWDTVWTLALERPVGGWGWVGYWNPLVEPFDDLLVFGGVTYLQAHNAWLDVFFQLGAIGLVLLALAALGIAIRLWLGATDPGYRPLDALLPLAIFVALIAQSLAESRLLIEWGWAFLIVLAVRSRGMLLGAPPTTLPDIAVPSSARTGAREDA